MVVSQAIPKKVPELEITLCNESVMVGQGWMYQVVKGKKAEPDSKASGAQRRIRVSKKFAIEGISWV
jgi:hypothetical protein